MKQTTQFSISIREPKTIRLLINWNFIYSNIKHLHAVQSDFSISKKKPNAKITNRTVSNLEENSLFLDLKPYAFLLKVVVSALSVPLITNLRRKEGVDSGAVQQGEPFPCLLCLSSSG